MRDRIIIHKDDELYHYGTPRHSGRYPWGSGENPYQHSSFFLKTYDDLRAEGYSEKEIADAMGMSTDEFRKQRSAANAQIKSYQIQKARELKEQGYNNVQIANVLGQSEGTIRNYLKSDLQNNSKATKTSNVAKFLKEQADEKGVIDVGKGIGNEIGVTDVTMNNAVQILVNNGYSRITYRVPQATNPNQKTTFTLLAKPGITWNDVRKDESIIKSINAYSEDGGKTMKLFEYPESLSSKRLMVRYAEDGGTTKDGVIELRRGVKDISLGDSNYAQVRIAVDGTHYLKGMAMYSDDMPDGIDVIFNTNKGKGTPVLGPKDNSVLKPLKSDPDNPFGATIKANGQSHYEAADGTKKLSVINKVKEEGDWDNYSRNLAAQFLSKQSEALIKKQLTLSYDEKAEEYADIMALTNKEVKKKLLQDFADDCDSSAVHLKAAALPRQSWKVILPMDNLKDNEIYAPDFKDGEDVVLIRYPHGGIFEIPQLKVNNKNKKAQDILPLTARDAVGINSNVAGILSGADFDGDTVLVIPVNSNGVKIQTHAPLEGLKGFDPKDAYPYVEGMKVMTKRQKGIEMGVVSNLITDMTLQGANYDELTRAVKHSMVVIDAEKHKLNYKQSEIDNGILELKKKYQKKNAEGTEFGGSSTLISRAKHEVRVDERKQRYIIDEETGERIFVNTGREYIDSNGKVVKAQSKVAWMDNTNDAMDLVSPMKNPKELAYAEYANKLKTLGNTARKSLTMIESDKRDPDAAKKYATEVASLTEKLNKAKSNSPKERMAQLKARIVVNAKIEDNPDMDKDELKKERQRALSQARFEVGASKGDVEVTFTDAEWEAVQNNAISPTVLRNLLNNANMDKVKKLAMPRESTSLSNASISRIRSMANSHYSISEIADAMGISTSTVKKYLSPDES